MNDRGTLYNGNRKLLCVKQSQMKNKGDIFIEKDKDYLQRTGNTWLCIYMFYSNIAWCLKRWQNYKTCIYDLPFITDKSDDLCALFYTHLRT